MRVLGQNVGNRSSLRVFALLCILLIIGILVGILLMAGQDDFTRAAKRGRGRPRKGTVSNMSYHGEDGVQRFVHLAPTPPLQPGESSAPASAPAVSESNAAVDRDPMFDPTVFPGARSNNSGFLEKYAELLASVIVNYQLSPVALGGRQVSYCLPDFDSGRSELDWSSYICPSFRSTQFSDGFKETSWCTCSEDQEGLRGILSGTDMMFTPQ